MAYTNETLTLKVDKLESDLALLLSNSVLPENLTATQRKRFTDAIYPNGVALQYDNQDVIVGDLVYGKTANINSGGFFFGRAVNVPVLVDADVNFEIEL